MAGISTQQLNQRFVDVLGSVVRRHGPLDARPFEVDFAPPLPQRVRVYIYTTTNPPGGRPKDEYKIQLTLGKRGERSSFDDSDGRIPLLLGYSPHDDVFVLWDATLMQSFAYSRNVQVKGDAIVEAISGAIARRSRRVRSAGKPVEMIVLAAHSRRLAEAILTRMELTRARLQQD